MAQLARGVLAPELPSSVLYGPDGGKMFGTLVVRAQNGRMGFLKAFSGQLEHAWDVEGFVPPVFDRAAREAIEPRGEACVRALTSRIVAAQTSPAWAAARAARDALRERQRSEEEALRHTHAQRRKARQVARALMPSHALNAAARNDEQEHRQMKTRMRAERAANESALAALEARLRRLRRHRVAASRIASRQLYDTYVFVNRVHETRTLRALFAPRSPPSGAGDCAGTKLLVFALRHDLEVLALSEFWWGLPPRSGGRREGVFYAACEEKCGVILPFLLAGVTPPSAS